VLVEARHGIGIVHRLHTPQRSPSRIVARAAREDRGQPRGHRSQPDVPGPEAAGETGGRGRNTKPGTKHLYVITKV
jgi:hypothetical protein